jgi:hypothetical protein
MNDTEQVFKNTNTKGASSTCPSPLDTTIRPPQGTYDFVTPENVKNFRLTQWLGCPRSQDEVERLSSFAICGDSTAGDAKKKLESKGYNVMPSHHEVLLFNTSFFFI